MKKNIYSILLYIFIFTFSVNFFDGITMPSDPIYWSACALTFAIAILLHKPILKFFTVSINFLTFTLSGGLLSLGAFNLMSFILPGFFISESSFEGLTYSAVTIDSFSMSILLTQVAASFLFSALCAMMWALSKSD